ncbi:hypothetical protein T265_06351 [Opisthorchis viverrini]|uniref:Coiled-coil domain-containing protein 148 n=1 Tax=Opisthorchis viverrini TaxID=6198 RepID=A0A074ZGF0_OPIVI|nr:hypothetical protein T265_06351 [Opisthorchis viverrini]KER26366.1 hypothetical protein T265_06351 [Opisthorchis viverrini]
MHKSVTQLKHELAFEEKQYTEESEGTYSHCRTSHLFLAHRNDMNRFSLNPKEMGIPDEAWAWKAPNDEFRAELLSEYIQIEALFFNRLSVLREQAEAMLAASNENEWSVTELELVDFFWDIFQRRAGANRKKMATHFLVTLLKHRSPTQLECLLEQRVREKQLKDHAMSIKRSWLKAREDLSIRIRASLIQACEAAEHSRMERQQHQMQRDLCSLLREQVSRWRKQRAEMIALEEEEQSKLREQAEVVASEKRAKQAATRKATKQKVGWRKQRAEMIALEEEEQSKLREQAEVVASEKRAKQAATRKATKQKVAAYKAAKMASKAREMEKEANRLAILRDIHKKQARIDTDRLVQAEKQRLAELHSQRVLAKERVDQEASRRQSRLDCIAKKVRPVVKSDPERITSETRAWRIKLEQRRQEAELLAELEESIPSRLITTLTTFSDAQLYADRRTRITAALHSAGLLDSDYARTLLSGVQPTVPPRKDSQTCEQLKQMLNPQSEDI